MSDLKPCPCGKIPERLIVHAEHSCPKWAWVTGSCCDGWGQKDFQAAAQAEVDFLKSLLPPEN